MLEHVRVIGKLYRFALLSVFWEKLIVSSGISNYFLIIIFISVYGCLLPTFCTIELTIFGGI